MLFFFLPLRYNKAGDEMNILYEDKSLLLCEKPVGVISEEGGLPALLREQTGLSEIWCVHRLDRETGGLMVYAKTKSAASSLSSRPRLLVPASGKVWSTLSCSLTKVSGEAPATSISSPEK